MIILLCGPDDYRRQKKFKEIIAAYQKKHSRLNSENFDLSRGQEEFLRFKDYLSTQSLFGDWKLAAANGLFETESPEELIYLLKSQSGNSRNILVVSERDFPPPEFKFLRQKPVRTQKFEALTGNRFRLFLKKEAALLGLQLSWAAEQFLAEVFAPDSWGLVKELEKLSLLELEPPLEVKEVAAVSNLTLREKIFDLVRILTLGQPLQIKLTNLEKLFLQKEAPAHIFNLLAAIAPPKLVGQLADYDSSIKSGGLDYEEALLDLVLS